MSDDEPTTAETTSENGSSPASEEPTETTTPSEARWRIPLPRLTAAVLAAVVLISGVDAWLLFGQYRRDSAATAALAAAESFALALTSIDSANIDADFTAVEDASTGRFKELYSESGEQLRQLMVESKAAAHGTVIEAAVESASPGTVTVLMFIDQTVRNKKSDEPQLDRSRVVVTMEKEGGRWLASWVDAS